MAASGSCLALVQAAADAFHEQYPAAHIRTVNAEGFRATESLLGGTAEMVVLTRDLLPEERQAAARVTLPERTTARR